MIFYQDIKHTLKQILPIFLQNGIRRYTEHSKKGKKYSLSNVQLEEILVDRFKIKKGDVLFLHSSLEHIVPENGLFSLLQTILRVIGEKEGTLLAPSYPKFSSRDYMLNNEPFNVDKSPSYSGILSELIRRMPEAKRSMHPTKSVVALGKYSEHLIKDHWKSLSPYDNNSPYYKLMNYNSKILGIGLNAEFLSFYHVVEDVLKDDFPVDVYGDDIFVKNCIDSNGQIKQIRTHCHYMPRVGTKTIKRVKNYLSEEYFFDNKILSIPFFYVESVPFFNRMITLAKQGHTVYSKKVYKK